MRASVDQELCMGNRNCNILCPEVFKYDGNELMSIVLMDEIPEKYAALALRANRAGWAVADNLSGKDVQLEGVAGTAVFKVFDLQFARAGLSFDDAKANGFDPVEVTVESRSGPWASRLYDYICPDGGRQKIRKTIGGSVGRG